GDDPFRSPCCPGIVWSDVVPRDRLRLRRDARHRRPHRAGDLRGARPRSPWGRRVVLITGRRFDDLLVVCPELDFFDWVVAENGAVLYEPRAKRVDDLAAPPPAAFLAALERAGVPFSAGRVIVSTVVPHETAVLRAIHDLGLELQIIFNRESVMVLPAAVSKQSGLEEALRRLGVPAHNAIGVGDAENDHAFLRLAGFAVAVGNAIPSLIAEADLVTRAANGAGVREFVDSWLLAGQE